MIGPMIPLRSTTVAGLLALILALPAAAQSTLTQSTGPVDSGVQRDGPSRRTEPPPPPIAKEMRPRRQPQVEPPARAEDDFELPPPAGCRYRDNKLDLLV